MNKRQISLPLLLSTLLLLLLCASAGVQAAAIREGSRGEQVKEIQNKLKRWGYYFGEVDGHFGKGTKEAVMLFQNKNGLSADGVVGAATAKALGLRQFSSGGGKEEDKGGNDNGQGELYLLARLVYGEARGEPYKGKVAVAAVVLNRVESSSFPNSVSGVVYQSGAFDVVKDGQINMAPDEEAIRAARDAMNGYDPTNGCLYYHNPAKSTNKWMLSQPITVSIGSHAFF